jgi:hypothetical protein
MEPVYEVSVTLRLVTYQGEWNATEVKEDPDLKYVALHTSDLEQAKKSFEDLIRLPQPLFNQVLAAIERQVGDDFSEEIECEMAFRPQDMTVMERMAATRLANVYRLAHSYNNSHSCYHVHTPWRALLVQTTNEQIANDEQGSVATVAAKD